MIALTATAVIENLIAAMGIADGREALHDLSGRRTVIHFLKGAVSASAKPRGNAIFAVLSAVEARRLLTQIPLRGGMILTASDP